MRNDKRKEEWLTGILIGIILIFLLAVKAIAAPVNSPEDAEREKARQYLSSNAVVIPEEVEFWSEYYGEQYDICPETIEAICWVESRCTPTAQDASKACKGLMQIKPTCHRDRMNRLDVQNIFGIRENIKVGTDYLAELGGSYDISEALMLYNGDETGIARYHTTNEISRYATKVLEVSAALERAHFK